MSDLIHVSTADPKAAYLEHKDEIDRAIKRVLDSGWYILGDECRHFESEFADHTGSEFGIAVANGTDALEIALRSCGVTPGDEVVTVSLTASATAAAIDLCGAVPVFVDIDPHTLTLDPGRLEEAISPRTRAIVPVHLYGHPADMAVIMDVARRVNCRVVEDCAQAHGAICKGQRVGTWGDMAAFSFYPTKNLGALGDGGIVVTSDCELAEKCRLMREYGWETRYVSSSRGKNSRLDEIQAAILRVKLKYLDQDNEARRNLASVYSVKLDKEKLTLPIQAEDMVHVYHQFVVRTAERDALQAWLRSQNVGSSILYPVPVHLQPAYSQSLIGPGGLPVTEKVVKELLCLPIYPELPMLHVDQVVDAIGSFDWDT